MADEESKESIEVEEEAESRDRADDTADKKISADDVKDAVNSSTGKKVICALCYLWGILFFLPLILYKDSRSRRIANEGLVLLLFSVIGNAVFGILTSFGGFFATLFGAIAGVYSLLLLLLGILGIVYVVTDKDKPLPIIGSIHIIK